MAHTDILLEKGSVLILIAISDNCRYSLTLHQNSKSSSLLKVSYNVESETVQLLSSLGRKIKSIGLSCILSRPFTLHDFVTKHWSLGRNCFTELCRSSKC